jgi:hypothetical protein
VEKGMSDGTPDTPGIDERTLRELTQLADGSLGGARRVELEERVAAAPELAAALERQRSAVSALRGLDLAAPASLRAGIAAAAGERGGQDRGRRAVPRRRLSLAGGLAAACAVIALLAVALSPGGGERPSVVAAAGLSDLPATTASVAVDPDNPKLLDVAADGVPFPNFEGEFGWRQAGDRGDELGGRRARTVFYERGGRRIGYTILAGAPIDPPPGSRTQRIDGVAFVSTDDGGQRIVTWLRDGHTCVLAGHAVSHAELVELASWTGKGSVPF